MPDQIASPSDIADTIAFPPYLFKAFNKRQYANDFINGKLRLQRIDVYKDIEDKSRKDATEGNGHLKVPICRAGTEDVTIDNSFENLNPKYLFCTSGPTVDIDHLKENYGCFIVRINNPRKLYNDLQHNLPQNISANSFPVEFLEVKYNKGEVVKEEIVNNMTLFEKDELSYKQKPRTGENGIQFYKDCEYRYVVMADFIKEPCPKAICCDFTTKPDYLKMI